MLKNKFASKQIIVIVIIAIIFMFAVMLGGKTHTIKKENISLPIKDFKIIK